MASKPLKCTPPALKEFKLRSFSWIKMPQTLISTKDIHKPPLMAPESKS